jgi:hypothetical protein
MIGKEEIIMTLAVPFRRVDTLYHWGTLDAKNVGKNGPSQEGDCLSASLCPDAWLSIARLGGETLYSLKSDEGRFVDLYAVQNDVDHQAVKDHLIELAVSKGFLVLRNVFEVDRYDEDDEYMGFQTYATFDEALIEANDCEDDIRPIQRLVGTEALANFVGIRPSFAFQLGELYAIFAAVKSLANEGLRIDGVYFADRLSLHNDVAPRFGVFPEKVEKWKFEQAKNLKDDRELLKGLGKIRLLGLSSPPVMVAQNEVRP